MKETIKEVEIKLVVYIDVPEDLSSAEDTLGLALTYLVEEGEDFWHNCVWIDHENVKISNTE